MVTKGTKQARKLRTLSGSVHTVASEEDWLKLVHSTDDKLVFVEFFAVCSINLLLHSTPSGYHPKGKRTVTDDTTICVFVWMLLALNSQGIKTPPPSNS